MLAQQIKVELNSFKMVGYVAPILADNPLIKIYRRWKSTSSPNHTPHYYNLISANKKTNLPVAVALKVCMGVNIFLWS